jgi:PIN domain nuclease of toxin-antitoxin system
MTSPSDVVLDTHVWLWELQGDERLPLEWRRTIDRAASHGRIIVSAVSMWEVAWLSRRGRITLELPVKDWLGDALAKPGMRLSALTPEIVTEAAALGDAMPSDPMDRLIAATARVENATLMTLDRRIRAYAETGAFRILPL